MTKRIKMPAGHNQLSLDGHTYLIDDTGAFEIPDEHVATLLNHGAVVEPGVGDLEQALALAKNNLAYAQSQVDVFTKAVSDATDKLNAFRERTIAADKARLSVMEAQVTATASAKTLGVKK